MHHNYRNYVYVWGLKSVCYINTKQGLFTINS